MGREGEGEGKGELREGMARDGAGELKVKVRDRANGTSPAMGRRFFWGLACDSTVVEAEMEAEDGGTGPRMMGRLPLQQPQHLHPIISRGLWCCGSCSSLFLYLHNRPSAKKYISIDL